MHRAQAALAALLLAASQCAPPPARIASGAPPPDGGVPSNPASPGEIAPPHSALPEEVAAPSPDTPVDPSRASAPPASRLFHLSDLVYSGSFRVPEVPIKRDLFGDICYVPDRGTLLVSGAGGIVEIEIPEPLVQSRDPRACPIAKQREGALSAYKHCRPLTGIPSEWYQSNGFVLVDKDLWISSLYYYNTRGNDYPSLCVAVDVFSTGLASPDIRGPYHVGSLHANRAASEDKGCAMTRIDPAWAAKHLGPGVWVATGGHRTAGAFQSGRGPNLFAWRAGLPLPSPHGALSPGTMLAFYPSVPATEWKGYRAHNIYEAEWCWTRDGRSAVLVGATQGLMTDADAQAVRAQHGGRIENHRDGASWYGTGYIGCDLSRGYFAYPYEPRLYLVDPASYEAVLHGADSWYPTPVEELTPDWTWPHPLGRWEANRNCAVTWFAGMSWDPDGQRLFVLHEGYGVHVLELR
jgi:hypothetical protein